MILAFDTSIETSLREVNLSVAPAPSLVSHSHPEKGGPQGRFDTRRAEVIQPYHPDESGNVATPGTKIAPCEVDAAFLAGHPESLLYPRSESVGRGEAEGSWCWY